MSQMELHLKRSMQVIDINVVSRQNTFSDAMKLCISSAGFSSEKELYMTLGIDASQWTRISKGSAHFPQDKINEFMDICGNEAPLQWLAHSRGYRLVQLETETQRENRELKEELEEMKKQRAIELSLLKELKS